MRMCVFIAWILFDIFIAYNVYVEIDYWQALDALVDSSPVEIDRPTGSSHPKFPEIIYPLDYGFLRGTISGDGQGIDVWLGASGEKKVTGLVLTADLYKKDLEQKVLCGCSFSEAELIRDFHRVHSQRSALIWRDD